MIALRDSLRYSCRQHERRWGARLRPVELSPVLPRAASRMACTTRVAAHRPCRMRNGASAYMAKHTKTAHGEGRQLRRAAISAEDILQQVAV